MRNYLLKYQSYDNKSEKGSILQLTALNPFVCTICNKAVGYWKIITEVQKKWSEEIKYIASWHANRFEWQILIPKTT